MKYTPGYKSGTADSDYSKEKILLPLTIVRFSPCIKRAVVIYLKERILLLRGKNEAYSG